jgi:hypothetical protein
LAFCFVTPAEFLWEHQMSFAIRRFGKLTVLKETAPNVFLCKCDCGTKVEFFRSQLANDVKRHCGCLTDRNGFRSYTTHGHSRCYTTRSGKKRCGTSGEFNSWKNMKEHCTVRSRAEYYLYGGRGIRVCERWLLPDGIGFANFLADMGPRPLGQTLDRINPQGHYEPTNCGWATAKVQRENQGRIIWAHSEPPPVEDYRAMERRLLEEELVSMPF